MGVSSIRFCFSSSPDIAELISAIRLWSDGDGHALKKRLLLGRQKSGTSLNTAIRRALLGDTPLSG